MKTMTAAGIAALLLATTACTQAGGARADSVATVTFEARPALSEGVDALPRLVGGGAGIAEINADLDRRDAAARAGGCDGAGDYERGVSQPMTGPGFVSFWIAEGYYCEGAARPGFDQTALTYDLATGETVDWVAAAPGLQLTRGDTTDLPATYVPGLSSPVLSDWYGARMLASTDREHLEECGDVWSAEALDGMSFKVWLNAEDGGLSVSPEFAHVVMACADTATLSAEEMGRFGVSTTIIEAVQAAQAAGAWAPKDQ